MKILWLTHTPCSALRYYGERINSAGWLINLENELKQVPEIDLHICFYKDEDKSFTYDNTTYHSLKRTFSGNKFSRAIGRLFNRRFNDLDELSRLLILIETINPDLIHIHGTEENFGLIQDRVNMPVVLSMQGVLNSCAEKYFSGVPRWAAFRYSSLKNILVANSGAKYFDYLSSLAKREADILKQAKNIIGRTDFDRQITRMFAPKSAYYVGNEILREDFYTGHWENRSKNNVYRIISIASGAMYKGVEDIFKTADVLMKHTDLKFTWSIVGFDDQEGLWTILRRWKKYNLNNFPIEFLGSMNASEIVECFNDSDLFCQVSHIENSPNSLCEAMMWGIPVVASSVGGTFSMLTDKVEGVLVQDGDPFAMAGAIYDSYINRNVYLKYAEKAKVRAMKRHDKGQILKDVITIYTDVLRQK